MKIKVNEGWQLAHDDGKVAEPGDTIDVDKATAEAWIEAGMATKVKAKSSSQNKARTQSANKAKE